MVIVFFYIVIQGDNFDNLEPNFGKLNVHVKHESFLGISNARNLCIKKATDVGSEYILFHDASICWTEDSAKFIFRYKDDMPKVNISFSDKIKNYDCPTLTGSERNVNPIYDTYVGSYLFKLEDISGLRFNLDFGPGQNTNFKSGEDVLFLFDAFSIRQSYNVFEAEKKIMIYHPPRDSDFSKHLLYAKGQGKMFRILLARFLSLSIVKDIILFFGNAVFRCLLLKKNSLKILLQRVTGFFS
ncbi:hypothetical protein UA31_14075 [Photobacterium angustum]|uniref:hypothetical protein n=1 Tax=Photobacterium angustum TaxID=661 RepID=UPI0005D3F94E|nr:hypothetical protein [Photobacterium angustum]KJF81018.1 hypothetical protein UB36_14070 [Photobacterium damselae subsp. damselae]KJG41598.1 hypothetical protein UA35_08670 [Photobacterium angustum]KJG44498.1 hypothetical protein UA31_14075 [Photobacterium angustum]KJG53373.1 hypothetical protein UA34_09080 [Photobacterium angustum]